MASAGTVEVTFAAETAKFQSQLKQVTDSLSGLGSGFGAISAIGRNFLPAISVAAVAGFAKNAVSAALALDDMAERAGIATSAMSRLNFAAEQTDLSTESLTKGIKAFQNTLSEANRGNKAAVATFDELGVSAAQLKALAPEDQIAAIAEGFSKNVAPIDRTRLAIDLFNKSGTEWIPLLSRGAEGVRELTNAAVALDDNGVKSLEIAEKAISRLGDTIEKKFVNILGKVAIGIVGFDSRASELEFHISELQQKMTELVESRKDDVFTRITLENGLKRLATYRDELAAIKARNEALVPKEADPLAKFSKEQIDAFRADVDRGQLNTNIPAKQRVAGAPTNFDELQQDFDEKLAEDISQARLDAEIQFSQEFQDIQAKNNAQFLDTVNKQAEDESNAREFWRNYDKERHEEYVNAKVKLEQGAVNAAIGLLQMFAGRSKTAALALVALEKGIAISRAIQNTAAGVTAVYADPTIPIYAKPAFAAQVQAIGAVQVGLIAATGLAQAAQISRGNASLGSAANPVFTQSGAVNFSNSDTNPTASSSRSVQVVVNGNVYNTNDFKNALADALKELDDVDTVIFSPNGAQAQMIRAAA